MTRTCVCCEVGAEMVPFAGETHQVVYRGATTDVEGLSGLRCTACGQIEYDRASADRYAAAGDALVLAARQAAGVELRRIRKKLRINQIEASKLTGGGHNAFSRYETGKVVPSPAVINLFRLLDRHPEEVETLRQT